MLELKWSSFDGTKRERVDVDLWKIVNYFTILNQHL